MIRNTLFKCQISRLTINHILLSVTISRLTIDHILLSVFPDGQADVHPRDWEFWVKKQCQDKI